jgi:hypothetical protein
MLSVVSTTKKHDNQEDLTPEPWPPFKTEQEEADYWKHELEQEHITNHNKG